MSGPRELSAGAQDGRYLEQPRISDLRTDLSCARITVLGVPDRPGNAARIFRAVARSGAEVDLIVQTDSAVATGLTDISFTIPISAGPGARAALAGVRDEVGFGGVDYDDEAGMLIVVAAGVQVTPEFSTRLFDALGNGGINIELISTSEARISLVTRASRVAEAARIVELAFPGVARPVSSADS